MGIWNRSRTTEDGQAFASDSERIIWLVYWDHCAQDAWMYGSTITFRSAADVLFKNIGMPPGFSVKEWFSSTDYAEQRLEPQLPLLLEGESYHVRVCREDEPENGSFLRLNFYDRQGDLLEFQMIQGTDGCVTCPEGAFRYTAQLVEGGARRICFHYLLLAEESVWQELQEPLQSKDSAERKVLEQAVRAGRRTVRLAGGACALPPRRFQS